MRRKGAREKRGMKNPEPPQREGVGEEKKQKNPIVARQIKRDKYKEEKEMFANYLEIKKRISYIEAELKRIESMKVDWPQGELICAKNSKHYKWYLSYEGKQTYLPKREEQLAKKLAWKKYYCLRKKDLRRELATCYAYMRRAEAKGDLVEKMMNNVEYEHLLGKHIDIANKDLEIWMNSTFERNNSHPENLIVKGTQGKMLRSKSEAIIDKILHMAGIPFRYEAELHLDNIILYPDFTIRHPKTGQFYYWEHFGMMDNPEYVNRACQKVKTYCDNGIVPSISLILTYETKEHPLGISEVEKMVKEYFI